MFKKYYDYVIVVAECTATVQWANLPAVYSGEVSRGRVSVAVGVSDM